MELSNEFTVAVPVERAWAVLTDVPTIAPCLPGAQLQEVENDEYRGIVKVKVGPIVAQYKGSATFLERDDTAHRAVLKAEGRETRGQGNASAVITAVLRPDGDATTVEVTTDLKVTGKVAQIGRGVMGDVSGKLMDEFADNLAARVLADDSADAEPAADAAAADGDARSTNGSGGSPVPTYPGAGDAATDDADTADESDATDSGGSVNASGITVFDTPEPEPIDLLGTAGSPLLKRAAPALGGLALLILVYLLVRRRRSD